MSARFVRGKCWCDTHRKVGYSSPAFAERIARNRNRYEDRHNPVGHYRCPEGNGWHVGHQFQVHEQRRRRKEQGWHGWTTDDGYE